MDKVPISPATEYIHRFQEMYKTLVNAGVNPDEKTFYMPVPFARELCEAIKELQSNAASEYQRGYQDATKKATEWIDENVNVIDAK